MFRRDNIIFGIILGVITPAIVVALVWLVFYYKGVELKLDLLEKLILFAFALNGFYLRFYHKNKLDNSFKGVMIATFVYVFYWVFKFVINN